MSVLHKTPTKYAFDVQMEKVFHISEHFQIIPFLAFHLISIWNVLHLLTFETEWVWYPYKILAVK